MFKPTLIPKVRHTVNRVVIAAKAFGLCGLVLKDDDLVATSRKLIAHALTLRDAEGVLIENGGHLLYWLMVLVSLVRWLQVLATGNSGPRGWRIWPNQVRRFG